MKDECVPHIPDGMSSVKIVLVTNIPAPYRNPVYRCLAEKLGYENFHVVFCAGREANREWAIEQQGFAHTFLKENTNEINGRYIHSNTDVIGVLLHLAPDVVITSGFNPTHLFAFVWTVLTGREHVPMTDGTDVSELHLSIVHRVVRRIVFKFSRAFVGASLGSARLYAQYGIPPEKFFQSHLCANNAAFDNLLSQPRSFDLMFCGRFAPEKNPVFALDVALGVARKLGRKVSILLVGSGPLLNDVRAYAETIADEVQAFFRGFVQQPELPALYGSAKLFLFPSSYDPWGVVANEACAAGQAVLVSPHAGVAGELIVDGENGYVLPLDLPLWIERATELLNDSALLERFSAAGRLRVQSYTYEAAAQGIVDAVDVAMGKLPNHTEKKYPTVVIIQRRMTDYRIPLFERLREDLQQDGIQLRVLYGDAAPGEQSKQDGAELAWGEKLPTRYFFGMSICWQPYSSWVRGAELVIVTQENKLISNLWPLFGPRSCRLAFWGHGENMQATGWRSTLRERFKRLTAKRVDWWFAYTGLSKTTIVSQRFPPERITVLENSIDTSVLQAQFTAVEVAELEALKVELKLGDGPVGLFIGSLYPEKRLPFLLEAGSLLAEKLPGFRLIVIGDGQKRPLLEAASTKHGWLRYVGRQANKDKARFLKLANVVLNPGLVGLGILDAFVAGVPLVTTDCGLHSPEIDYLHNHVNGFMTANNLEDYVKTVERVLTDTELANRLRENCTQDAKHYTIENMSANFRAGILQALN
jgi:glycosyltransferase involved in cell wall biosynthesis